MVRLLDLFCGAGGCSVGYHRAGFTDIVGVDLDRAALRRYPFQGIRMDAMTALAGGIDLNGFDAIHASPPCQAYSIATRNSPTSDHAAHVKATGHLLLDSLAALTQWGERTGKPWVIENVPGAPMPNAVTVCGRGVGLPNLERHRLFASNIWLWGAPCAQDGTLTYTVTGNGSPSWFRRRTGRNMTAAEARHAMGIDWMNRDQLSQAIPPAYTEHIGWQLLQHIKVNEPSPQQVIEL